MLLKFLQALNTKSWKTTLSFLSIFLIYLSLFVAKSKDYTFGIVGGYVGAVCASITILDIYYNAYRGGAFRLLFWRACCDLGIALRFILIPAFNKYICHASDCDREEGDESNCGVPAALLQFFLLASEVWYLCSGIELIYSVTNPFSRFEPRLKYYHFFSWFISIVITMLPFVIRVNQEVYGWWYLSVEIDDQAFCWLKIQSENVLGTPMTLFFFLPLLFVYFINLLALFIAFNRLRKGLNRSFLPRLKILVSSAIHVFVLVLYWLIFFSIYGWAFANRDNRTYNGGLFAMVNFIFASKGFSSFLIWILTTDHKNLKNFNAEEKVEDNVALREEVLSFATAGIRNTARAGPTLTAEHTVLARKPQQTGGKDTAALTTLVTPLFFIRFVLGEAEELAAIETIVSSKRRSVDDNFSRTTVSSTPATMLSRVSTRLSSPQRLSQRATIVTNRTDSGPFSSSNQRPFQNSGSSSGRADSSSDRDYDEEEGERSETSELEAERKRKEEEEEEEKKREEESDYHRRSSDMIDASETYEGNRKKGWLYVRLQEILSYVILDNTEHVEFYEYQPFHFRRVRLKYGISDEVYISAFSTTIKERLTEGGASGAFFFYSKGEKLIAKSCTESEFNVLTSVAQSYADYIEQNPRTYISKILGTYELRIYGTSLYFFVMNNLFYNKEMITMNEKYDIKGSWFARNAKLPVDGQSVTCSFCEQKFIYRKAKKTFVRPQIESLHRSESHSSTGVSALAKSLLDNVLPETSSNPDLTASTSSPVPPQSPRNRGASSATNLPKNSKGQREALQCPYTVNGQHSPNVILKDNDIKYKIRLPPLVAVELLRQIRSDADFLFSLNMMDYSLLVGVHNTEYDVHEMRRMRSKSRFTTASHNSFASTALSPPPLPPPRPANLGTGSDGSGAGSGSVEVGEGVTGGGVGGGGGVRISGVVGGGARQKSDDTEPSLDSVDSVATVNPNKIEVMRVIGPDSYFIGIIDFQQRYTWKKKLERFFKINFHGADPRGLSSIEPQQYRDRFIRKIEDIVDLEERLRRSSQTGEITDTEEDFPSNPMIAAILEAEERFTPTHSYSHKTRGSDNINDNTKESSSPNRNDSTQEPSSPNSSERRKTNFYSLEISEER